ncbi:flagellar hook protein FlgE [Palleronia abyssalis]|uniref:Flagellar hook protein FlgE n=1 Tax=Palleronia abyssalis TaxID=1501240 RepID=A0A2R8BSR1_9RHOB|nr:flagellar hook-basal body complex protein [Palleronia abyssalis]SPJ23126.1 Flagellar hook protein FlgE [Palleronia abyssalis]
MSISSSLAAGVSGLSANAERLASISDNIANSATYGYKRSTTDFHTLVVNGGAGAKYTAGGITTSNMRLVDERGQLQTTSNATDIAINGRGFLPVRDYTDTDGGATLGLKTTGSFRPNAQGFLVDATGQVLLGIPANIDGTFPKFARDSSDALRPVSVFHNQFAANPTDEMKLALNLPSSDSEPGNIGAQHELTIEYYGNLGQTEQLTFGFTSTAANTWQLEVTDLGTAANVGTFDLSFNDLTVGGGTLASVTPAADYDAATGELIMDVNGAEIRVDIGLLNEGGGITQLNSTFAPSNISKNGSTVGNFAGVEVDPKGVIHAIYDSGFTRPIYQVPVVDVANPNGLTASDSGTFEVSLQSGNLFMWDAGTGPVGETAGYTREASTTDVAMELTQLIQTQRAYSSNAKVIQTVDEMLQETANLKR